MMYEDVYLSGKCLVAMPDLEDENFKNSVIYLCSHNNSGAFGLVVNHRLRELSFADLAMKLALPSANHLAQIGLYNGGPLEKIRGFVLHSTDYVRGDTVVIDAEMAISSSVDILNDISFGHGPEDNLIALGYANWQAGQLEKEILCNRWMVVEPSRNLIFRTKDEDKWQRAMDEFGINFTNLSPRAGRA